MILIKDHSEKERDYTVQYSVLEKRLSIDRVYDVALHDENLSFFVINEKQGAFICLDSSKEMVELEVLFTNPCSDQIQILNGCKIMKGTPIFYDITKFNGLRLNIKNNTGILLLDKNAPIDKIVLCKSLEFYCSGNSLIAIKLNKVEFVG